MPFADKDQVDDEKRQELHRQIRTSSGPVHLGRRRRSQVHPGRRGEVHTDTHVGLSVASDTICRNHSP